MPYVRFVDSFDWVRSPAQTVGYKAGWEGLVTTPCASAAVAAGKAVRVTKRKAKSGDAAEVENEDNADGDEQENDVAQEAWAQ